MVYRDRNLNQEAIANLNSTSPLTFPETISAEDLARDLDLFTNTEFFDFDFGGPSSTTFTSSLDSTQKQTEQGDGNGSHLDDMSHFSFLSGISPLPITDYSRLWIERISFDLHSLHGTDEEPLSKRPRMEGAKGEETPPPMDDAARAAAEEDKRRRNTLASARFRAKKKMREQALEKDHKEMSAKIEKMESKIKELELENKWLRGLVVQNKP